MIAAGCIPPAAPFQNLHKDVCGLGMLNEIESDEYYTDRAMRPKEAQGMPVEMRKLIKNSDSFLRATTDHQELLDVEDQRIAERARRLPAQNIPRKIWQVCWDDPVPRVVQAYANTWTRENSEYVQCMCSAAQAEGLVREHYPELVRVFRALSPAARQDYFAYLVLFKFGGVFASPDTTCELPIRGMILPDDDLVVGLQPRLDSRVLARRIGAQVHHNFPLQQWCLASAPGHPVIRFMVGRPPSAPGPDDAACPAPALPLAPPFSVRHSSRAPQ
jgi:mannosyltransferase OCH1-like enzyme